MIPSDCPDGQSLPGAAAMKTEIRQRIPYPADVEDDNSLYGGMTNGQRISGYLNKSVRDGIMAQSGALLKNGDLDPVLRELIIVRIGYTLGSYYEVDQHSSLARSLGVSEEKLLSLACTRPRHLNDSESAMIAFVDGLLQGNEVPDDILSGVQSNFTNGQVLEMIWVTGNWWTLARMLSVAGVPVDEEKIGESRANLNNSLQDIDKDKSGIEDN